MANKARALRVLKAGGKLVNGLICLPGGGLDRESKGRLTPAQLSALEKTKGVAATVEGSTKIHTYQPKQKAPTHGQKISPALYPARRNQGEHSGLRR